MTDLFRYDWVPATPPRARLVLAHGFGEHAGMAPYTWLAERLTANGYAVHAFDQRGHGRSPGRRGHVVRWDDYRGDLDDVVRDVAEAGGAVILLGVSAGGLGVVEYLAACPDAPVLGAAIVAGALGRVGASPVRMLIGRLASHVWPTLPIDPKLDLANLSRDSDAVAAFVADPLFHQQATARGAAEFLAAGDRARGGLADIRVPLLVLHGGDDRIAVLDAPLVSRLESRATVKIYPWARHQLLIETNRDEVVADLVAWLATVGTTRLA